MLALAIDLDVSEIILVALFIGAIPVGGLAYIEIEGDLLSDSIGAWSRVGHTVVGRVQIVPRGRLVAVSDQVLQVEHGTLELNAAARQVSIFLDVGVGVHCR